MYGWGGGGLEATFVLACIHVCVNFTIISFTRPPAPPSSTPSAPFIRFFPDMRLKWKKETSGACLRVHLCVCRVLAWGWGRTGGANISICRVFFFFFCVRAEGFIHTHSLSHPRPSSFTHWSS